MTKHRQYEQPVFGATSVSVYAEEKGSRARLPIYRCFFETFLQVSQSPLAHCWR